MFNLLYIQEQYETIFIAIHELARYGKTSLDTAEFLNLYVKKLRSMRMGKQTVDDLAQVINKTNIHIVSKEGKKKGIYM